MFYNYFYVSGDQVGLETVQLYRKSYERISIIDEANVEKFKAAMEGKTVQEHVFPGTTLFIVESDKTCFEEDPARWTWISMDRLKLLLSLPNDVNLSINTQKLLRAHYQVQLQRSYCNADKFGF
jgi:hypothetical protein